MLGPGARLQAPPNLTDPHELSTARARRHRRLGRRLPLTPDHVNPERPWPEIDELSRLTAEAGFTLHERLTVHPHLRARRGAVARPAPPPARPRARATSTDSPSKAAIRSACRGRSPTPRVARIGTRQPAHRDRHHGRTTDRRSDFEDVYGDWSELRETVGDTRRTWPAATRQCTPRSATPKPIRRGFSDGEYLALLNAEGRDLDALAGLADRVRHDTVGDRIGYVVNRNINFTNVCYTGCRFCAFAQRRTDADAFTLSMKQVGDRVDEAWTSARPRSACRAESTPTCPAPPISTSRARSSVASRASTCTPSARWRSSTERRVPGSATTTSFSEAQAAGLDTIPGTAAEILDDEVRWVLTKGKLPASAWIEIVTTAHKLGIRSSSTMMYGHVDNPSHWVGHLRTLSRIQDETGGFTEFVLLPFIHTNSPVYLAGVARPGPTPQENRAVHAVARLMLHGRIDHIQTSWVKLGTEGTQLMLQGGADDVGGTLMEETISRMAGADNGSEKTVDELELLLRRSAARPYQRTTTYGVPTAERAAVARAHASTGYASTGKSLKLLPLSLVTR